MMYIRSASSPSTVLWAFHTIQPSSVENEFLQKNISFSFQRRIFGNSETSGIWTTLFMFIIKSLCTATASHRLAMQIGYAICYSPVSLSVPVDVLLQVFRRIRQLNERSTTPQQHAQLVLTATIPCLKERPTWLAIKVSNQKTLYYATSHNSCFCTTWQNREMRKLHFHSLY